MKPYHCKIALLMCVITTGISIAFARQSASRQVALTKLTYRLKWIEETASNLLAGDSEVELYSMRDTDRLLSIFSRRADITSLRLEMTDITSQGVSAISAMPALKQLSFSGDQISNEMLDTIASCRVLEKLHLEYTRVNGHGLRSLSKLENLQELAIDANWDTDNAENAVQEIKLLKRLTRIEVGAWATENLVEHLRQANPSCLVVQKP